jgi:hypothetical protein
MMATRCLFNSPDAGKGARRIPVADPGMVGAELSAEHVPAMDPRRSVDETPVIVLHPATRGGQPEEAA